MTYKMATVFTGSVYDKMPQGIYCSGHHRNQETEDRRAIRVV